MKRLLLKALAFLAALTVGVQLYAAPPANDNLADAQELTGDFGIVVADTAGATWEDAENSLPSSYYGYGTNTVWYKWTSTAKEQMPFHFAYTRLGDEYINTEVRVFAGTSYEDLEVINGSSYEFCAEPGKTYMIRLRTYKPAKVALCWYRNPSEGEWKILAADGVVYGAIGYLPEDIKASDFPAGVTEIAKWAFEGLQMKFVTIPATVTKIGDYAFAYSGLAWVDYEGDPAAVEVADTAFVWTPYGRELPFKLILDQGVSTNTYWNSEDVLVTNIHKYCDVEGFVGTCPEELVIPDGVTEVLCDAFYGATTLVKVIFPSTLEYVEDGAFTGCSSLAEVSGIPAGAEVEYYAFYGSLYENVRPFELVTYDDEDPDYDSWDDELGLYTRYTTNTWVSGFHGTCPEELTIPEGIYGIDYEAFSLNEIDCEDYDYYDPRLSLGNLKKVILPTTVKAVEEDAFSYLPNLEEVVFLGSLDDVYIDYSAFTGTPYYLTVNPYGGFVSPEFELIADYWTVDGYWQNLYDEYGNWTNEVWVLYDKPIGYLEVYGCVGTCPAKLDLTHYFTDDVDVVYIDSCAFVGVDTLTELILPDAGSVDRYAFADCENLATVTIVGDKDEMEIDDHAFIGTPYFAALPFRLIADSWTEDGISYMKVYGYVGTCPAKLDLTQYLADTAAVVYVYEWAFAGVDTLTELILPSAGYVDEYAFAYCENLATVTISGDNGEMEIDDRAFVGCSSLPFRLIANFYTEDGYWQELYDEYGNWTNDVWVLYDKPIGCLEVSGYVGTCPPKLDLTQYFANVVDEVTYINDDAFAGLDTLTELVLPNGGFDAYSAFRGCANLAKVTIGGETAPDKEWLTSNFLGTPWLDTAVPFELITEEWTNITTRTVYTRDANCCTPDGERWTEVTNTVVYKVVVGYYGNVPASLTFPVDVNAIDDYVFEGCDNITDVVVPGNVREIGYKAFAYCDNLQNVEFQEGVECIGDKLFYGCGDGMQVILPTSVVIEYYDAEANEWRGGDFYYTDVFYGINGDVDVVAPRTACIYDRAFYCDDGYDGYFGRTCVEYYTLVVLDPNGGTVDGDAEYRCYDDVMTGLTTPVLTGNVFREWWDDEGGMWRNGDVFGANDAQVYLTAEWAAERVYTVYGLDGPVEIELGEGDDYETLRRVLADAYGVEPEPSRHGLEFLYWTVDGAELNHRSAIGEDSTFGAYFDEFNPLSNNPDAAVDADAAQTYDGYVLDYQGNDAGTIQVKVGKPNKRTGEAKVSATVQMFGTKKISFKADPKGSWKLADKGSTKGVTLSSSAAQNKVVIDISEKGIFGTFGSYDIIGSRNTSKKDAAYANWVGRNYEVAFKTQEGTGSAFTGGYSGVTLSIAGKGKVKITGVMADGAKVSASAQLLISDTGEGCINAFVPMYSGKKGGFGFVLWIDPDYKTTHVESVSTWISTDSKTPFKAELEVVATSTPAPASAMTFTLEAAPTVSGRMLTDYLPTAVKVAFNGGKLTVAKANKIKLDKSSGAPIRTGATDNDAGLKLSYVAKTGSFKGSFTVYSVVNSKLKKYKATVNGVFVNDIGYGTAVIKDVGSFPVIIHK